MYRLYSLFRIPIIVCIVLSGCQSAKAVVTELKTTANATATASDEPLSFQSIVHLPSQDSQPVVVDWTQPSGGEYPRS